MFISMYPYCLCPPGKFSSARHLLLQDSMGSNFERLDLLRQNWRILLNTLKMTIKSDT
jgi:hypothetical protein